MLETVHWETPTYDLARMDAEIGSYQVDHDSVVRPRATGVVRAHVDGVVA